MSGVLIAGQLGTSAEYDHYLFAVSILTAASGVLVGQWVNVLTPIYQHTCRETSIEDGDNFLAGVMWCGLAAVGVVTLALMVLASGVVRVVSSYTGEQAVGATQVLRCSLVFFFCLSLSSIQKACLNSSGRFRLPAALSMWQAALILLSVIFLVPHLGVYALVTGLTLGQVVSIIWMERALAARGRLSIVGSVLRLSAMRHAMRLSVPTYAADGVNAAFGVYTTFVATGLAAGGLSALTYGQRIADLVGGAGVTMAGVVFPRFAELRAAERRDEVSALHARAVEATWAVVVPLSVYCYVFAPQIISLLFLHGRFNASDHALVTSISRVFALGMMAVSVHGYTWRLFYAFQDTRTPLLLTCLSVAFHAFLLLIGRYVLGTVGVAIGLVLGAVGSSVAGLVVFHRMHFPLRLRRISKRLVAYLATGLVGVGIAAAATPLVVVDAQSKLSTAAVLAVSGGAASIIVITQYQILGLVDVVGLCRRYFAAALGRRSERVRAWLDFGGAHR